MERRVNLLIGRRAGAGIGRCWHSAPGRRSRTIQPACSLKREKSSSTKTRQALPPTRAPESLVATRMLIWALLLQGLDLNFGRNDLPSSPHSKIDLASDGCKATIFRNCEGLLIRILFAVVMISPFRSPACAAADCGST